MEVERGGLVIPLELRQFCQGQMGAAHFKVGGHGGEGVQGVLETGFGFGALAAGLLHLTEDALSDPHTIGKPHFLGNDQPLAGEGLALFDIPA